MSRGSNSRSNNFTAIARLYSRASFVASRNALIWSSVDMVFPFGRWPVQSYEKYISFIAFDNQCRFAIMSTPSMDLASLQTSLLQDDRVRQASLGSDQLYSSGWGLGAAPPPPDPTPNCKVRKNHV